MLGPVSSRWADIKVEISDCGLSWSHLGQYFSSRTAEVYLEPLRCGDDQEQDGQAGGEK